MLIKALCDYADRLEELSIDDNQIPVGYSNQQVHFEILLNINGEITNILDVRTEKEIPPKNEKGKPKKEYIPKCVALPERLETTKVCSNIIEHRPLYIFGLNYDKGAFFPTDKTNKAKKSHDDFVKKNLEFFEGLTSDICVAYYNFIKSWKPEEQTENQILIDNCGKLYKNSYFIFGLDGYSDILLHNDEQFMRKYQETFNFQKEDNTDNLVTCGILGEKLSISKLHDVIKLPQGNPVGCKLVCMNSNAYESYGKINSYNSNVSEKAMKKYTSTLNKLLANDDFGKKHHIVFDDMTIIYFAMKPNDTNECNIYQWISHFNLNIEDISIITKEQTANLKSDEESTAEINLANIFEDLQSGKSKDLSKYGIDDKNVTFYTIGLTPNSSRISQKFLNRNRFSDVIYNMIQHQNDITISNSRENKQVSFQRIFKELISPKSKNDKVSSPLKTAIMLSALNGTKYPDALLETVIRRIKIDSDEENNHFIKINNIRVGLIKGYLNRKLRLNGEKEEFNMALDKNNLNPAYNCGRLFAVLEKIQLDAQGQNLNSTIKDRYFSSVCSKPSIVFPTLIKLSNEHLSKMRKKPNEIFTFKDGKKVNVNYTKRANRHIKLISEIMNNLGSEFPSILGLENQGKFIIGYYHQSEDFRVSNYEDSQDDNKLQENND